MYGSSPDPYVFSGTDVLINLANIRDGAQLERFEFYATQQRASEPLPRGRYGYRHFRAVHKHLFQDVDSWAGKPRTVRLSKHQSVFCYPEHIDSEMTRLFSELAAEGHLCARSSVQFVKRAAYYLSEWNAVHAFREGNGRTQLLFLTLIAEHAGHAIKADRIDPALVLAAMIASFGGKTKPLETQIARWIEP